MLLTCSWAAPEAEEVLMVLSALIHSWCWPQDHQEQRVIQNKSDIKKIDFTSLGSSGCSHWWVSHKWLKLLHFSGICTATSRMCGVLLARLYLLQVGNWLKLGENCWTYQLGRIKSPLLQHQICLHSVLRPVGVRITAGKMGWKWSRLEMCRRNAGSAST